MVRFPVILLLLILQLIRVEAAFAQARGDEPRRAVLSRQGRQHLERSGPPASYRSQAVRGGRIDTKTGLLRAAYRQISGDETIGPAEERARRIIRRVAPEFGWDASASDLDLEQVERGRYSNHVTFRQTFRGLPVYGSRVKVNLDRQGREATIVSGYVPISPEHARANVTPLIPETEAVAAAAKLFSTDTLRVREPELLIYPEPEPRPAWRMVAWTRKPVTEWEVLVDAHTGDVIRLTEQSTHPRSDENTEPADEQTDPVVLIAESSYRAEREAGIKVDGSALVFDPDPLTTAGSGYSPPYIAGTSADDYDAAIPELNAQRIEVTLPDLAAGSDGLYRLIGPYVEITGDPWVGGSAYNVPVEEDPHAFRYGRENDFFEAVMAYYHIDKSRRYAQSLDVGRDVQGGPILVNPHGLGRDDLSYYYPEQNAIAFGTGGIDDAEDAFVIWHEYGHALMEYAAPGIRSTLEGQALHEGWADYWAASYVRAKIESATVPFRDWRQLFFWDGNETWNGRRIDHTGRYPEDTRCDDPDDTERDGCRFAGERAIYDDGNFWASVMMEIYARLGREITDRLALASFAYLNPPTTFADAAEALVQADRDLYDGAHSGDLLSILQARGLIEAGTMLPALAHDPRTNAMRNGQTLHFEVQVKSNAQAIRDVFLYWSNGSSWQGPVTLLPVADDWYAGDIPVPTTPGLVRYYFEAFDKANLSARLPLGGAEHPFGMTVGTVLGTDVLNVARANGRWTKEPTGWYLTGTGTSLDTAGVGLVLVPIDLSANTEQILLELDHAYSFGGTAGGCLELSTNGGRTWTALVPVQGNGSPEFTGQTSSGGTLSLFDLSDFAGQQAFVRLSLTTSSRMDQSAYWRVKSATLYQSTFDNTLELPLNFGLHTVFPNPFSTNTTISYTIPEAAFTRLEAFDLLGRRIALLEEGWKKEGTYSILFDAAGLPSGVYLLHLSSGEHRQSRPVTIVR